MNIRESISLAFGSLRTNKMRAFLTLLGIIVGISSVIAILTLGHGLKTQTAQSITSSGANDLSVQITQRPKEGEENRANDPYAQMYGAPAGEAPDEDSKLDINDIQRIKDAMGDKIAGVPIGSTYGGFAGSLVNGERSQQVNVSPVNLDFLKLNNINVVHGRAITQKDLDNSRPVIMISQSMMNALFDSPEDAIGGEVEFEGQTSTSSAVVVGVFAPAAEASGLFSFSTGEMAYMPYTASGVLGYQEEAWTSLYVRPAEGEDVLQVKAQLQAVLTSMYRSNEAFHAEIQDFSASTASFNRVLDGISAAISAIAGISLLVGGIGVMNIMLVTVTERTREIGVRKALGATRSAIRLQFVVEAMIVCLVGGVIGVLAGGVLGMLGTSFIGGAVFPPLSAILLSLGFSLAIGLFFGYYPANKAAKLDPIDALRYE